MSNSLLISIRYSSFPTPRLTPASALRSNLCALLTLCRCGYSLHPNTSVLKMSGGVPYIYSWVVFIPDVGVAIEFYRCAPSMSTSSPNRICMPVIWNFAFVRPIIVLFMGSVTLLDCVVYTEEVVKSIPMRKTRWRRSRNSVPLSEWKRFTPCTQLRLLHSTKLKQYFSISERWQMKYTLRIRWGTTVRGKQYRFPKRWVLAVGRVCQHAWWRSVSCQTVSQLSAFSSDPLWDKSRTIAILPY